MQRKALTIEEYGPNDFCQKGEIYVLSPGYGSFVGQKKFSPIKQKFYRRYGKSYHCLGYTRQNQYTQVSVGRNFRMTLQANILCWVLE